MRSRLGMTISLMILATAGGVLMTTAARGQTVVHLAMGPSQEVKAAFFDIRRDGLRLGDRVAARGPLLDETRSAEVGTGYLQCLVHERIIEPNQGLWNCNYVLKLADGDIVLQGLDPRGPGVYEVAVVGGTGAYVGANGDATFTDESDADGFTDMVIRLSV